MAGQRAALSVIIPVRNGAATIGQQLSALADADPPRVMFEVIVADNGSSDETASIAASFARRMRVRVVDASRRTGANAARNVGVANAEGEWLLFCDADDEVDRAWLTQMEVAFENGHSLVGGPIDYRELNSPLARSWRGNDEETVMTMFGFLPAAHFANMGMTRATFDRLDGLDESFTHGGDDVELCWRAQLAGIELHEVPGAIVNYRLRPSLREHCRQFVHYGTSEVILYRRFKDAGMARRPLAAAGTDLWWLFTRLPFAWPIERRGAWLKRLAIEWGRIKGALRYRTWWW